MTYQGQISDPQLAVWARDTHLRYDFDSIVQFYTLQLLMMSFIIFVYENRMIQRKSHHKISGQ